MLGGTVKYYIHHYFHFIGSFLPEGCDVKQMSVAFGEEMPNTDYDELWIKYLGHSRHVSLYPRLGLQLCLPD
jgi:hypothetical protein